MGTTRDVPFESLVQASGQTFQFGVIAHLRSRPEDRFIEAAFYNTHGSGVPKGDHFELELVVPIARPEGVPIHIHRNPDTGKDFVCFPGQLPNEASARTMFMIWCIGTAYSLVHKKDFNPLYKGNPKTFINEMEAQYGITFTWADGGGS